MAEIVVNFVMDKLTTLIQEEVHLLRGVKEEAVLIKDKLEHINALLIAADEVEDVRIKQLRDVAYDIEDALDEFRLLTHHPDHESHAFLIRKLSTIKNIIARHQMAAEIQRINSRIQSISVGHEIFQSKTFDAKISAMTWDDQRQNALLIEEADLVGIENPKKQLVSWLIQDDTGREVVSVVGMGGLGKTTLVKKVYDDAQVKLQFKYRAWITVSQSFKMEELLKHMLQQLYRVKRKPVPQELDSMTNDQLKTEINSFLQHKTKRYLIVLDDLWGIEEWDAVKYAFPNSNSSRVMLTTRNYDVASASCKEFHGNVYSLNPLPLEESRTLFCRKTFGENSCPPHFKNPTERILQRCEGLPLAIVAISGVMATKGSVDEWDMILRSLGDELKENARLNSVEKILSLSYKDLPYYLKSCFLYFSIFPKNHVIDQMRLIRLWIAEGFVRTKDNMTLEEVAQGYLYELLNRSLIQVAGTTSEGRIKTCRVHDLLREIISSKVREQNFVTIARGQNTEWPEKVRRLSIHKTMPDVLQSQSISHLRSLHIFWRVDSLSSLSFPLDRFKLLNVLDLQGAPLEVFPNDIIKLFLLKYLSLRSTMIKIIPPAIGNLRYLETLDLKHTCITALPVEILKLQKLRHLLVYRYEIQSYAQINSRNGFKAMAQIGCLHSLQKLCHIEADHGSNAYANDILRELGKLDQLRRLGIVRFRREHGIALCTSIEMLKRLRALSITSIEEEEVLDLESLSCPPPFLQRLFLSGRLEKLPHWMSSLHSLAKISLKWSQLRDDPLEFLQDLPNLVHLEFLQVYEGETLHFNAGGFQRLKVLSLDKMDGLKMVIVEKGAMSSLEKLILQRCKLLHSLPSGIEHLSKLKSLEFYDMPNELIMTLRPDIDGDGDGGDYWKVKHVPEINSTYWNDGGWDVFSLYTSIEGEGGSTSAPTRSFELPPYWK
ncbi:disease resistance protein RPM1-like isoform X3 [Quercus robur]|uniref:disease resistance protein RPM1-like isoform X3 n=1 Tax=Quercus robur TaxID=38942 RepID=UPI002162C954|nr:disease resistance protein RPM1-like isoform X3 [Quercus robur]